MCVCVCVSPLQKGWEVELSFRCLLFLLRFVFLQCSLQPLPPPPPHTLLPPHLLTHAHFPPRTHTHAHTHTHRVHHQQIVSDHQDLLHVVDTLRGHSSSQVDALKVSCPFRGTVSRAFTGRSPGRGPVGLGGGWVVSPTSFELLSRISVALTSLDCSICRGSWMMLASKCLVKPQNTSNVSGTGKKRELKC